MGRWRMLQIREDLRFDWPLLGVTVAVEDDAPVLVERLASHLTWLHPLL